MVLAFTEGQKQEIESNGIMAIELKRRLKNLGKAIEYVMDVLCKCVENVVKACKLVLDKIHELFDDVKLIVNEIRNIKEYPTSRRYNVCKILSKCTGIEKRELWKMTRNTWLARSCC